MAATSAFESIAQDYYQVGVARSTRWHAPYADHFSRDVNNGAPNWSRDGKSIYFYSGHDLGLINYGKCRLNGGLSRPGDDQTGVSMGSSRWTGGSFIMPNLPSAGSGKNHWMAARNHACRLTTPVWYAWDVARDGIYFLNLDFPPNGRIEFFDFAHGQSTPILALDKPFPLGSGLALSPDGKSLLFGQIELTESDIMVMKNFR